MKLLCASVGNGTQCTGTITAAYADKIYYTVQIDDQCRLKENLDVGTMIQSTSGGQLQTGNGVIEKYCYDNTESNCDIYGGLYEWTEAMQYVTTVGAQGICPDGWHIPTSAEFNTLRNIVGYDGNALKAIGQGTGGGVGTNTSGFSALLAGYSYDGTFHDLGVRGNFWSSFESSTTSGYCGAEVYYINSNLTEGAAVKVAGKSVRCLKD